MFLPVEGALIAGRYALERVIGRGGMGQVWRAHDRELGAPCAVKFLLPHLAIQAETRARFLREARAAAVLRSPHAVQVLGAGEQEGTLYLAMELLEGESLAARLKRDGALDAPTTFAVVEQVSRALSRAHDANIVHRDLKPDNIWLCDEPDVFIKVLDFGVAKATHELGSVRTSTGMLLGTPQYMSPEQANGDRSLDHRSDLWSLAIITFECLTGKRPFEGAGLGNLLVQIVSTPAPKLTDIAPQLPAELDGWWRRALARDPADRFQCADDWLDALRPALLGATTAPSPERRRDEAGPESVHERAVARGSPRSEPRSRWRTAATASGVLLLALVAASLLWQSRPKSIAEGDGVPTSAASPSSGDAASGVRPSAPNAVPPSSSESEPGGVSTAQAVPALDAGAPSPREARPRQGSSLRAPASLAAGASPRTARPLRARAATNPSAAASPAADRAENEAANVNKRLGF